MRASFYNKSYLKNYMQEKRSENLLNYIIIQNICISEYCIIEYDKKEFYIILYVYIKTFILTILFIFFIFFVM